MDLVRESGNEVIVNNPVIPNEQNEAVMKEASDSVFSGLQNLMNNRGPVGLKSLFNGVQNREIDNQELQEVTNQFSGNLSEKFGINSNFAKTIAAGLIPIVLSKLLGRAKNQNDSGFNIEDILGSLRGGNGNTGNPQGNLQTGTAGKSGLDRDGDGDTDLKDLMSMFGR